MKLVNMLKSAVKVIEEGGIPSNDAVLVWPAKEEFVPKDIWKNVNHDDIDWVIFVPDKFRDLYIRWIEIEYNIEKSEYIGGILYEIHH